jgi:hypothetical protein
VSPIAGSEVALRAPDYNTTPLLTRAMFQQRAKHGQQIDLRQVVARLHEQLIPLR